MPNRLTLLVALAGLAAAGGPAAAQRGRMVNIGPGSTPEGDIARGYGILYDGLGRYNVNSAIGRSIDADTMIRWNEYVYSSLQKMNREAAERYARNLGRIKANHQAIMDRIREKPDAGDLMRGDALNFVLEELCNPRVDPSVLRLAKVPLNGGAIRTIPFMYGELGGVISLRQLQVKDGFPLGSKDGWPIPLRGEAFRPEREAYRDAVDGFLELNQKNKVTAESVKAVQLAVRRLRAKADAQVKEADHNFYVQTNTFLKSLERSAELLQTPIVGDILAEVERYPGTTVAELIEFMRRYNLRFAPASSPAERQLYAELFPRLGQQRTRLDDQMAGRAHGDPPPAEDGAPDRANGVGEPR